MTGIAEAAIARAMSSRADGQTVACTGLSLGGTTVPAGTPGIPDMEINGGFFDLYPNEPRGVELRLDPKINAKQVEKAIETTSLVYSY